MDKNDSNREIDLYRANEILRKALTKIADCTDWAAEDISALAWINRIARTALDEVAG